MVLSIFLLCMHHRLSNLDGFTTGRVVIAPILADYDGVFEYADANSIFEGMELGLCFIVGAGKAGYGNAIRREVLLIPHLIRQGFDFTLRFLFFQVDS